MIKELVYAGKDIEDIIKAKYTNTVTRDASDCIHTERFELKIPDVDEDEFYSFAIKEGFVKLCLVFNFMLGSLKFTKPTSMEHKETKDKIERWIRLAK